MAAISSIVMMFEKGDHFVVGDDVYGGTYRVLTNVFNRFGVEVTYVNTRDLVVVNDAELVRMQEHESNTQQIVQFLKTRNDILSVFYPGLEGHPDHDVQKKQARGFGGMVSFDVGSAERADQVLSRVKYFTLAESLGAVESLISVPARMTHASIPQERRAELGITEGLVRISVGLEDIRDLIEDLEQALSLR